jgi:hypothetical protein
MISSARRNLKSQIKRSVGLETFAGSKTTGSLAAESICNVKSPISNHAKRGATSAFRFVDELPAEGLGMLWSQRHSGDVPVEVNRQQRALSLLAPGAQPGRTQCHQPGLQAVDVRLPRGVGKHNLSSSKVPGAGFTSGRRMP